MLRRLFKARASRPVAYEGANEPPIAVRPVDPSQQSLGPNQLAWLDKRFAYYHQHRANADAPVGTVTHNSKTITVE